MHGGCFIGISIFDMLWKFRSKASRYISALHVKVEIRIECTSFFFLVGCIEYNKHIFADKLVISVEVDCNSIFAAKFVISYIGIFHCSFFFGVFDVNISFFGNFVELKIFGKDLIATVIGCIVDDNCEIVSVVLSKD